MAEVAQEQAGLEEAPQQAEERPADSISEENLTNGDSTSAQEIGRHSDSHADYDVESVGARLEEEFKSDHSECNVHGSSEEKVTGESENGDQTVGISEVDPTVESNESGVVTDDASENDNKESYSPPMDSVQTDPCPKVRGDVSEKMIESEYSNVREQKQGCEQEHGTGSMNSDKEGVSRETSTKTVSIRDQVVEERTEDRETIESPGDSPDICVTNSEPKGQSLPPGSPPDKISGSVLSPEIFSDRISSDGGSVEIAEEADEEISPTSAGDESVQNSTSNHPHSKDLQTERSSSSPTLDGMSNSQMSDGDPKAESHSSSDDINDRLLSELTAELQGAAPNSPSTPNAADLPNNLCADRDSDESRDDEKSGRDECASLKRLVEEWKKKYCHAEAELQSLRVTVQASSKQSRDLDEERTKQETEARKEAEAVQKVHLVRIKELEKELEGKKKEIAVARERQISHDSAAKKAISQLQHDMIQRVDKVKQLYEEAVKEKENMVIRYAKSEKENLDVKKAKEDLERRLREAGQGLEVIVSHNKQLKVERTKLLSDIDAKDLEITAIEKEKEEMKDDVASVGIKVKWAQNKLKTELESHKETKAKLAKTEQRLVEAKEETEQIRKNCQEMIRTYQESEEIRSNSLDIKLKEKEEELKQQFQEKEDHMEIHNTRLKELEALKKAHQEALSELDSLKVKSKCLEDERLHTEGLLNQFKGLLNSQKEENRKLSKQMEELKSLKRKLDESKQTVAALEHKLSSQKQEGTDLESELETSRQKEAELLQFTEKMTATNAALHSENSALNSKVDTLTEECRNLKVELEEAKTQISQLSADLNQERQYREREAALLSARLSEKSKALDQVKVQLSDAKDETKTLKRKHAANMKDLTRQLQHAKKKIDTMEADSGNPGNSKDAFSSESRTSSTGSLDTLGNSAINGGTANISSGSSGSGSVGRHEDSPQAGQDHTVAIAGGNDFPGIDKGMLVERIVRLQKQLQKKADKMEFMQEHNAHLVGQIQKKSKVIQQYIMREEAGALAPAASDANKAQMSKQGGIMASVYKSHSADPNMTLDLSLEINRKLQAVLEDTLLKNITLKENIDTLGQEIARLSEEVQLKSSRRGRSDRT